MCAKRLPAGFFPRPLLQPDLEVGLDCSEKHPAGATRQRAGAVTSAFLIALPRRALRKKLASALLVLRRVQDLHENAKRLASRANTVRSNNTCLRLLDAASSMNSSGSCPGLRLPDRLAPAARAGARRLMMVSRVTTFAVMPGSLSNRQPVWTLPSDSRGSACQGSNSQNL